MHFMAWHISSVNSVLSVLSIQQGIQLQLLIIINMVVIKNQNKNFKTKKMLNLIWVFCLVQCTEPFSIGIITTVNS